MKKLFLILVSVISAGNFISGQDNNDDFRNRLLFGLKAGINVSNVYDTKGADFVADPKLGFAAGAFLTVPIGEFIGFQPEILLSQKGFKSKILGIEFTHTSSYIDIPLLFALKPNGFATLLFGPQFSYLVKQKDKFGNASLTQGFTNDNIRKNTFSLVGGIDLNLSYIVISARGGWDIQDNNGDGTSTNPRYKNVWYQATLGFRF